MSDLDLEPLPPDVQRLLELERPIPSAPAGLAPKLLETLAPRLSAAAGLVPAVSSVASGLAAKVVIATLAFTAGAGAMHWVDVTQRPVAPIALPAPAREARPVAEPAGAGALLEEQALVEQARAALMRGNPADAIAALDQHGQKFPAGQLAEHREAIAVQALAAQGKTDEAGQRANQFREKWPHSILLPVVDQATAKKP